jgi:hypothetical protein
MLKNISVIVGENEISYFKINENKKIISWAIYMIMDYQIFGRQLSLE